MTEAVNRALKEMPDDFVIKPFLMEHKSEVCGIIDTEYDEEKVMKLVQLKGGKAKKGIYHIQHINSYHSELKRFMVRFNGVSTKHLDNYLIWHNFVNYAPESDVDKRSILLKFVLTQNVTIHAKDIAKKPALPFVA